MKNHYWVASVLPLAVASVYLGCNGDEDNLLDTIDSGTEPETGAIDRRFFVDASVNFDASVDADADDGDAFDAYLFECGVMNGDSGALFGDADCNTCMSQSCCTDITACFTDEDCIARVACIRACEEDAGCRNACKSAHAASNTLSAALSLCSSGFCNPAGCGAFP